MTIKRNFALAILDSEKIADISEIILKHSKITLQSSSHTYFDTQPVNPNEIHEDIIFFQMESEDESIVDEKIKDLINELNQLNTDYSIRDEDNGEMLVYVEFVGTLDIKFDNIKIIKDGTFKKIDELKLAKTEFGICKGYKPNFRPIESQEIEKINIKPESIYLFCHSQENLLKLKDYLSEKVMEIDSDFILEFRQFMGEKPEFKTMKEKNEEFDI